MDIIIVFIEAVIEGRLEDVVKSDVDIDYNVKIVINHDKLENRIPNYAKTPLHIACGYGHVDIVKYFYEKGVNMNVRDTSGRYPILIAAFEGHLNVLRFLMDIVDDIDEERIFKNAVYNCQIDIIRYFIEERKIDVQSIRYKKNFSLLNYVCKPFQIDAFNLLLEAGCSNDINEMEMIIMRCIHHDNINAIRKLISTRGFDVNLCSIEGLNPLWNSALQLKTNIFELFLYSNPSNCIDIIDRNGQTLLLYLLKYRNIAKYQDIIVTLLKGGASLHFEDNFGDTGMKHITRNIDLFDFISKLVKDNNLNNKYPELVSSY